VRQRLNEDPKVQAIVIGVIGVIAAFFLFTTVMKKDPAPAAPPATNPAAATDPEAAATPATPAATTPADPAATAPADPAATATTPPEPSTLPPATVDPSDSSGLLPSKGLPKEVLVAYASNKAIALLVVDPHGLSDQRVKTFAETLRSRDDVSVFIVDSPDIGDYSRITAGVRVDRVPALVVVRPRKLTEGAPTATVSYGFRGPKSVDQAVDDALYQGKPVPSYP
jgi:hypothetical protein